MHVYERLCSPLQCACLVLLQVSYDEFLDYFANMDEQVLRTEQWRQKADLTELKNKVSAVSVALFVCLCMVAIEGLLQVLTSV